MHISLLFLALIACTGELVDDEPSVSQTCVELWTAGESEPDETGPDSQLHGTSVFDGEHIWMAWNRRDATSKFDVWLAQYDCGGNVIVGPFEVTQADDLELDPVLAISNDTLMVAWASDNGAAPNNLDIRYRLYDLDGTAKTDVIELAAQRNDTMVTGNATQPALAGTSDGFLLAGSWGHNDATAFQVFGVQIGLDGAVLGQAVDGELDTEFGQLDVAVAVTDDTVHLLWQEDSVDSTAPALTGAVWGTSSERVAEPGARPAISALGSEVWRAWDSNDGTIILQTPAGEIETIPTPGFLHSPSITAIDGGAVVVGMIQFSGFYNSLMVWKLDAAGTVVDEYKIPTTEAASPYGIDVTVIDERHVVVVHQDGSSPNFRLKAEWISFGTAAN